MINQTNKQRSIYSFIYNSAYSFITSPFSSISNFAINAIMTATEVFSAFSSQVPHSDKFKCVTLESEHATDSNDLLAKDFAKQALKHAREHEDRGFAGSLAECIINHIMVEDRTAVAAILISKCKLDRVKSSLLIHLLIRETRSEAVRESLKDLLSQKIPAWVLAPREQKQKADDFLSYAFSRRFTDRKAWLADRDSEFRDYGRY